MDKKTRKFKDDIETAERNIMIISWLGVFSALIVILYAFLGV